MKIKTITRILFTALFMWQIPYFSFGQNVEQTAANCISLLNGYPSYLPILSLSIATLALTGYIWAEYRYLHLKKELEEKYGSEKTTSSGSAPGPVAPETVNK